MKNILTIIKKEFARFFKDRRLILTTLILPGLLIYLVYSFMGSGLLEQVQTDENYVTQVYTINAPDSFENYIQPALDAAGFKTKYTNIQTTEKDQILKDIEAQEVDLLIEFEEGFDEKVAAMGNQTGQTAPYIYMYYNSVKNESQMAYAMFEEAFTQYESTMTNRFDINPSSDIQFDLASNEDITGTIFGMLLPFLILMFLFSGCMSVAPESIAGEKERGTIATLLVTPIKRSELAIGKITSLSVIAVLCAISSFIGTIASLPKMIGMEGGQMTISYQFGHYIALLLIIISTVLVMIGLISIISAFAKSVKEATTLVTPLMILVMVVGIIAMFSEATQVGSFWMYLIPIYNSLKVMGNVFSFHLPLVPILLTILSNIIFSIVFVYLLTKMFNSERVMFSR